MMGDTNLETLRKHYFDLDFDFVVEMVADWSASMFHERSNAETSDEPAIDWD